MADNSYKAHLLERGYLAAIRRMDGWAFAQVLDFEDVTQKYDRIDPMAANAATHQVAGDTAVDWRELLNADGEKLLYDYDGDTLLQVFFGLAPDRDIRVWRRIPSPMPRGNMSRSIVKGMTTTALGFLDGTMTPYDDPSVTSMMLLPSKTAIDFGFLNMTAAVVKPRLNFFIRRIQPKWLNPTKRADRAIIQSVFGGRACTRYSPGLGQSGLTADGGVSQAINGIAAWGDLGGA